MDSLHKRNDAVRINGNEVNGKTVDIAITEHGSDWYYAICATMGFVGLSVVVAAHLKPRTDRAFFYITAAINITACIVYYVMGSNLGWVPIDVEFPRTDARVAGVNREIFYARYIDWVITTPLLIMDLLLTAGMPWSTILWTIFLDEVMIITGLVGALVRTRYKWGFYAFGCAAMLAVFWNIAWIGRAYARHLGSDVSRVFTMCGVLTLVVWLLYPIAWGVSEGGNVIAPDSEAVFYGILDFFAKPIFSIALIIGHWNIDPERLGLKLRDYGTEPDYFGARAGGHGEKLGGGHDGPLTGGGGAVAGNGHAASNAGDGAAANPAAAAPAV